MKYSLIYFTAPSKKQAHLICKKLLSLRLIACANVLGKADSFYRWKGKIEKSSEWSVLLKTRKPYFQKICKVIRNHHSYTVPAILEIPVNNGDKPFLDWIQNETRP